LDNNFQILDDYGASDILNQLAQSWLRNNEHILAPFLRNDSEDQSQTFYSNKPYIKLIQDIATAFIQTAKDMRLTPEALSSKLSSSPAPFPLAQLGCSLYSDYQRALAYRGMVDFNDLICLALEVLQRDSKYLSRLQYCWPYIFEDEAQDSSRLQEQILRTLVGVYGNWVRVGDPNQAIFETFTTASPKYLRSFLKEEGVIARELTESGRSAPSIIAIANRLISWTESEHPVVSARDALTRPFIEPAPPGDVHSNPEDTPLSIHIHQKNLSSEQEIHAIVSSITHWLPNHPEQTVAILSPNNDHAFKVVDALKKHKIEVVDNLLKSTSSTRRVAEVLGKILHYLSNPQNPRYLASAYEAWRRGESDNSEEWVSVQKVIGLLQQCQNVESYIFPRAGLDWLETIISIEENADIYYELKEFKEVLRHWEKFVLLPFDQIILALSQELFFEPSELSIAHHLAIAMRRTNDMHPEWRTSNLTNELNIIAENERRVMGIADEDIGFDPDKYKGKVVVATIHKSKGLEWDRVYLTSINNYDFPSAQPEDVYRSERWFIRNNLNLTAETLAQLKSILSQGVYEPWYEEGVATHEARLDIVRERLRLLYVGITRAKRELTITWNTGQKRNSTPAKPLEILSAMLSETNH
jgi:DNA helicase-2/ATP-dependent DNA helicase PcrA